MFRFLAIFSFFLLFASSAFAEESAVNHCKVIRGTKELYDCILSQHPRFKSVQLSYDLAKANRDKVTQWPNPQVNITSVEGKNSGDKVESTEIGVSMDVTELLVKRPALRKSGRSQEKLLTVQAQEEELQVKGQIIKDLFRYRQLVSELDHIQETLATFVKISNQYRSRKARGPDQDITLNLVELAQGDYQLKKNNLMAEKSEIEVGLKGVFGNAFEIKKEWLPALKTNWPDVQLNEITKSTFQMRKAEAEMELAEAEKGIADAESWPRIAAGPQFEKTTEAGNSFNSTGFNVNVSVPIFSLNGGAREVAQKGMAKARLEYEFAAKKADLERSLIFQKYKSAVEALKKSTSSDGLHKKHNQIDNFFSKNKFMR